ncbi:MAG: ribosome small subunit-dependent GTPase, partial [Erysipelotrichales bacterium]|nr:ribosome small subunit-dependent GTPase [Erysipelotrichales bacterium]
MKTARVIRIISNQFQVLTEEGVRMEAVLRKKARRLYPVVGDVVEIEEGEHAVTIENVKERKNCLTRP